MARLSTNAKDYANEITMHVSFHNVKEFKFRVWLGQQLIRLAAWVMWVNVEIEGTD